MRKHITLLALIGLLGATGAGCGNNQQTNSDSVPTTDPKAQLTASTAGLAAGNYAFTVATPGAAGQGIRHLASNSAAVKITSDEDGEKSEYELRYVHPDQYIKFTMDTSQITAGLSEADTSSPEAAKMVESFKQLADMFSGKYWMHMDRDKVKGRDFNLDMSDGDITGLTELLSNATVTKAEGRTLTGTLDATKLGANDGPFDNDEVKAMGQAATTLPYTISLDEQGRITKADIQVPKAGEIPAGNWVVTVDGYGTQAAQAKPTGQIKETPPDAYDMLNK